MWCASNSETLWTDRKMETDNGMIRGAWELGEGGHADRGGLREALEHLLPCRRPWAALLVPQKLKQTRSEGWR